MPILPSGDYAFQSERVLPPDDYDYGERAGHQNRPNVLLQVTAPAEYLSSQLNPPLITDNDPTFSAIVHNNISRLSENDFIATVAGEHVRCIFNPALNEVSFTPASPLNNGNHHAMLIFKNPDGSARSLYWSFRIETEPPNINLVMWSKKENYALVILDRPVEPSLLANTSRWLINNETGITRADIYLLGGTTAFLPLENSYFDKYTNKEPLTITFVDKNGNSDYIVRRGGSMVRKAQDDPPCDCTFIDIILKQDHHYLEAGAEKYAFCYSVENQNNCNIVMEWEGWTVVPIGNLNPVGAYEESVDTICANQTQSGGPGDPYPPELGFHMELNNLDANGMETVTFPRQYTHDLNVSFWADCTTGHREGDPSNPYETWITDHHYAYFESFDCKLPVFDEEPIVLYGDEAADLIHYEWMGGYGDNWETDIPLAGENVNGDLYCNSIDRNLYIYTMQQLIAHKCDLFIVTKASDPITGLLQGNMLPQHMVLDYKYTDETYWYGFSGGDPGAGNIVIDKKPWADRYPGSILEELELFNWMDDDWPPYLEEDGYQHDWTYEEIAINWWNLTDILTAPSEKEIKEIKVRITDNTSDPVDGYDGNWRRSGDVMEQLGANSAVKIEFIDHNSHDEDANWKIVNYSGDTNSDFTSFIYTRDTSGVAETNLFVYLETEGHVDPRKPIQVTLKSSEQNVPPEMLGNQVTINTYLMRENDFYFIPGGRDRLKHLFGAQGDCTNCHFYHAILLVSDSEATRPSGGFLLPVLYISSSDHKFDEYDDKMDYAVSVAYKNVHGTAGNASKFAFGKPRGTGYFEPDESDKKWYSYDEFLTSGGIEIVKVVGVESGYNLAQGEEFPEVPVQSEADVLLVISHGVEDHAGFEMAILGSLPPEPGFSHPNIQTAHSGWNTQADFHAAVNCSTCQPTICTDYGTQLWWNWWGDVADKGNFWQKKSRPLEKKELRWLAAIGCSTLAMVKDDNENVTGGPILDWKAKITIGYLSSVCGFTGDLTQFPLDIRTFDFVINGNLVKRYGNNMKAIYIKEEIRVFEPTEPCFRFEPFWWNSDPASENYSMTTDISVAAWMEAACDLYGNVLHKKNYKKQDLDMACAIDQDNVSGQYHYWVLEDCRKTYYRGIHKYNVKILRHDL